MDRPTDDAAPARRALMTTTDAATRARLEVAAAGVGLTLVDVAAEAGLDAVLEHRPELIVIDVAVRAEAARALRAELAGVRQVARLPIVLVVDDADADVDEGGVARPGRGDAEPPITIVVPRTASPVVLARAIEIVMRTARARQRSYLGELRLARVKRIAQLGTWVRKLEVDRLTLDPELRRLLGVTAPPDTDPLAAILERVHPLDHDAVKVAMTSRRPHQIEFRVRRERLGQADAWRTLQQQASLVQDEPGGEVELMGTVLDISPLADAQQRIRERTEEIESANDFLTIAQVALQESRQEVAEILANISQGILTIDEKLRIGREYSAQTETILDRKDLKGLAFPTLLLPGAADGARRAELVEWLKLVFHNPTLDWERARSMTESEYQLVRTDGTVVDLRVSYQPIRDGAHIARIMVMIEDLTQTRRLERAIEDKDRELSENTEHLAQLAKLDPELYEAVFAEAAEIVERARGALATIHEAPDPTKVIDRMFRDMHTLKGNAMSFGLLRIAAKAHWVEDAFSALKKSAGALGPTIVRETEEKVAELGEMFQRLQKMASQILAKGATKDTGAVRPPPSDLKIDVKQAAIDDLIRWAESSLSGDVAREVVLRVRSLALVPLARIYNRFPRMIGDLAESLGKQVEAPVLIGGDVGVEARAFNQLSSALVHLLRNAIDHGIEAPAVRTGRGKPARGTITVRAYHDDDRLRIDVSDDGGGIDGARLVEVARAKGILADGERPTGDAALELIFRPGLSTAKATTDVSGRGVGMDAVRSLLEELGGGIAIESEPGHGTRFRLWVPRDVVLGLRPAAPAVARAG